MTLACRQLEKAEDGIFLTSDAVASIVGTALPVGGGWTAH